MAENRATSDSKMITHQVLQNARENRRRSNRIRLRRSYSIYVMLIPGILLVLLFSYVPMYGLVIGFKDYNIFAGSNPFDAIAKSPWVGLKNWTALWTQSKFRQAVANTFIISALKVVICFPIGIILALMINEVRSQIAKRTLQTVMYLPHFVSWVVVGALFMNILGTTGIVNTFITALGGESQKFFMDNRWFRFVLLLTSAWKESGWNTIVYLAAIASIDPALYEAARIDRANRLQQIWYVTLPGIASTIVMMFILRLGGIMDAGFSQILVMYNPTVYKSGDIIGTFVYREGIGKFNWSQGTMVGFFNSIINMVLILGGNMLSRKLTERSIW
ncbi:MAG: ABC transporter permease [Candidatus Faecivicinus sp.]